MLIAYNAAILSTLNRYVDRITYVPIHKNEPECSQKQQDF